MVVETKETPQSQDIPLEKPGQSSEKVTPKEKKTYSEAEFTEKVLNVHSENGRLKKDLEALTKERNDLKSQVKEATNAKEETLAKVAELEADLEESIGEDTDLRDIQKIKKELRAERDKLRQEVKEEKDAVAELRKTTEAERDEWAGTVAEAQTFKFDSELAKLVDEYDGDVTANFTKLKTVCEKAGIKTKEGAEALAETFLTKKYEETDLLDDSGVSSGGGEDLNNLSSRELLKRAYKKR